MVGEVGIAFVGVVVAISEASTDLVEHGDGSFGVRRGTVIVSGGVTIVRTAFEPAVELAGGAAVAHGDDVVDIAVRRWDVTAGWVLAVPVADLDRSA